MSQAVIEQSETSSICELKPTLPQSDIDIADNSLPKPIFPLTNDVSCNLGSVIQNNNQDDQRLQFAPELKNDDALISYVYENFSMGRCLEEQVDEIIELVNVVPLK